MTTTPRRIARVEARPAFRIHVVWQDRGEATVDMTGVIHRLPYFESLKDETEFQRVAVVAFGSGIEWANGIDYSADSIEVLANEQSAMTPDELRAWKQEMVLSLNEMADIFGVSVSTIKSYLGGNSPIPVAVQIACNAMRADPRVLYARFRPRVAGRPQKAVATAIE